jgi:peptidyl-tRNA hydrolase
MADPISQKIVVNMDIPMSLGRICAQAAHASWLAVLQQGKWYPDEFMPYGGAEETFIIDTHGKAPLRSWLQDQFTKVMLRGWGDQMLLDLKTEAEKLGLPVGLMEEDGHLTALAIGPAYTEEINQVTGKLHLL